MKSGVLFVESTGIGVPRRQISRTFPEEERPTEAGTQIILRDTRDSGVIIMLMQLPIGWFRVCAADRVTSYDFGRVTSSYDFGRLTS